MTDGELMLKVAGYDSNALEELYGRYSPFLFTLINKITGDRESAGQILSDVFVIVWQKIERFDFKSNNVYTWLVLLARNKAIDAIKRRENPAGLPDYNDEYENAHIIPKLAEYIAPLELEKIDSKKDGITDALNKLTDAQKYVVELAFYNGLKEDEIAKKLNIPVPTVKSKIQVILTNLHKKLIPEIE
jgi:RNA polymerase sigma-70 factor (ECF subfamily)